MSWPGEQESINAVLKNGVPWIIYFGCFCSVKLCYLCGSELQQWQRKLYSEKAYIEVILSTFLDTFLGYKHLEVSKYAKHKLYKQYSSKNL